MNCPQIQERMIDVLYGELLEATVCFAFYKHLDGCEECSREFAELAETRRSLSEWEIEDSSPELALASAESASAAAFTRAWWNGDSMWRFLPRAAALVLMAAGAWALMQQFVPGMAGGETVRLKKADLYPLVVEAVAQEQDRIMQGLQGSFEDIQVQLERAQVDHQQELQRFIEWKWETDQELHLRQITELATQRLMDEFSGKRTPRSSSIRLPEPLDEVKGD